MSSSGPPKFPPFRKLPVVKALEASVPDTRTDLTAHEGEPYRNPLGKSVRDLVRGPKAEPDADRDDKVEKSGSTQPRMFTTKEAKKAKANPALEAVRAPAKKKERLDLIGRDAQVEYLETLEEGTVKNVATKLFDVETKDPYKIKSEVYAPVSRMGFGKFLYNQYRPIFPSKEQRELNVATCAKKGEKGVKEVKVYHYQAFVREYLRYESPYRGLLVYHGLGSGKTCSAIAAAEALFGTHGMKIVVMTPLSLQNNFIGEISFCGFKHFRLQNFWTSMSLKPGSTPEPEMVKLFAKNIYGIPDSYFAPVRGQGKVERIWIPDFSKKPNFDTLEAKQKQEIQTQLKVAIQNRITFINYNTISKADLKQMVCKTPEILDNSVIVVDEIHNLTRLMQGSLEVYLASRPGRSKNEAPKKPQEVITPERAPLKKCTSGKSGDYMRGYLFYRLFMDAKNVKIVGLSGTPLINFPEELGILMNILHGPIRTIEFDVGSSNTIKHAIENIVKKNENLDTVFHKPSDKVLHVTITRLPEQFIKEYATDHEGKLEIQGIKRRDLTKAIPTLETIWAECVAELKKINVVIDPKTVRFLATELLPAWDEPFRKAFIQDDGLTLKNVKTLQKRIRGLISYYKGSQGNVMPKVVRDEIVAVPLTGHALKVYLKIRKDEIQAEQNKPSGQQQAPGAAIWSEIAEVESNSSNYRMSSRQACNFAFPDSIVRPRMSDLRKGNKPGREKVIEADIETGNDRGQVIDVDIEGLGAGRDKKDAETEANEEDGDKALKEEAVEGVPSEVDTTKVITALTKAELEKKYKADIAVCKQKLRDPKATHLKLDGPPNDNLLTHSPKFHAMLTKINQIKGSSLVYSVFLGMEGIGIFGMCMEANGYELIEIIGEDEGKFTFSEKTKQSLLLGPTVKRNRYITFTGEGTKDHKTECMNLFNANIGKLSAALQEVLIKGKWVNNFDGSLCRVFCITAAGAEGLSLKTVRSVHIMEPYWNNVRLEQVKGRAVRICSHMDLEPEEQTVEVYTYCTTIGDGMVDDESLYKSDGFPAIDAEKLGVPVPAPGLKLLPVPTLPATAATGNKDENVIRFYSKSNNDYKHFSNSSIEFPFVIDGLRYPSVEHYIQSMKYSNSPDLQKAIREAENPKEPGKGIEPPTGWRESQDTNMFTGLEAKFKQNPRLLDILKNTGTKSLVYKSNDIVYGDGATGKGANKLGKFLEQLRNQLKEYTTSAEVASTAELPAEVPAEVAAEVPAELPAEGLPTEGVPTEGVPTEGVPTEDTELELPLEAPEEEVLKGGNPVDRTILLTSDQKVLLVSLRKERVLGSLQDIMKTAAVDCLLNKPENGSGITCLELAEKPPNKEDYSDLDVYAKEYKEYMNRTLQKYAYNPDLTTDISETIQMFGAS